MSFQKEIKIHLGNYKKDNFKNIKDGKWRNYEKNYPHILPKDKKMLNLLPQYKDLLSEYIIKNKKELKLHTYFNHLNSSQAMCLNFFYPLLKEKKLDIVLKAIGLENEKVIYEKSCFEKKSEIEEKYKKYRMTYFDFYIETESGKKIFFEIKYTEQKFGKAKLDKIHIDKFKTVYLNNLSSLDNNYQKMETFLDNYQIFRNIICVSKNSIVVFLYPEGNKNIKKQAEFTKLHFLKKNLKNNLINLTWENLISFSEKNINDNNILTQLNDFKEKYKV